MASASRIDLLILDVNGVLYRYDEERRITTLAELLATSPSDVRDAVFESGLEDAADAGDLDPDEYLSSVGSRLGVGFGRAVWRDALADSVTPNDDVLELLDPLRDRVAMATLSNNGLLVAEEVDAVYPRIAEMGIEFHVAAAFGASKPSRGVYRDVCDLHGVDPAGAALVDDKQTNVEGARRAGLAAHHFRGTPGLRGFLDDLGVN